MSAARFSLPRRSSDFVALASAWRPPAGLVTSMFRQRAAALCCLIGGAFSRAMSWAWNESKCTIVADLRHRPKPLILISTRPRPVR